MGDEGLSPTATRIGDAVRRWLATLDPGQRSRAIFPFDSAERFAWDYRPGTRQGLSLAEMTTPQRDVAQAMLNASLSDRGAAEVRAIIALEPVLGELERLGGKANWSRRDPDRYWFAVFGEAGARSPWSWRIGGHHVALQWTVADGRLIGSAPSFLGANPATVPSGPFAGHRAIDGEEMLARMLLASLSMDQRRIAMVDPVAPPDITSGNGRRADVRDLPSGIRHDQLETAQRSGLERLIRHYLDRSDADVAEAEWDRIRAAGLGRVTFAWAGSDAPGRGHYYAVRGPGFVIEYDNTQDGANHIHAVWRDLTNDWGEDLLAAHYRAAHLVK
jgi:plasmid stabilization system protein ParE